MPVTSTSLRSSAGSSGTAWTTRSSRRSSEMMLGVVARRRGRLGDPGRYLSFLRGGPAQPALPSRAAQRRGRPLAGPAAPAHRAEGRRSHRASSAPRGTWQGRPSLPPRATVRRSRRLPRCRLRRGSGSRRLAATAARTPVIEEPWWSPRQAGGLRRPPRGDARPAPADRRQAFARPWDEERIAVDRAHLLRRMAQLDDAP